ncbi:GntR family transcriptional regulator [Streptomyces sp. NBC_01497]|uniref:GntR family transcriptional regulator n=1 Tax=Streptomyces sp. NBC_01497 TaxID=2903885 RepID=UPI002E33259C|nr:GntR family transcriptional regulator [Streptomyces sp. NBC_01497]
MRNTATGDTSAAPPEESDLTARLSAEILTYLREENPPIGHRLTERALAERLRVSRSPVRNALRQLHRDGFIERTASGRYLVARSGAGVITAHTVPPEDEVYLRIAADRLDGVLPDRITKTTLLKRYDLTRTQLDQLLLRISNEGWIAPLPGYGWTFLPVLTSMESYRSSYRFRLLIEPAGILEPTFRIDREAIERRRSEQQRLVDEGLASVTGAQLFDLNTRFHETLAECTNNDFFVESLARVNRLRRLIEYRQALVPERAVMRCREHVELADLLLAGELTAASAFLQRHLTTVGVEKSGPGESPQGTA